MIRRMLGGSAVLLLGGCLFGGGGRASPPAPAADLARRRVDSLWTDTQRLFRSGKYTKVVERLDRLLNLMDFDDPRRAYGYFMFGEAELANGNNFQAVRYFRRVADETGSEELAPEALVRAGDAYAQLWARPELDPSNAETAMFTYSEALQRYPGTPAAAKAERRMAELREQFAMKEYKAALFYLRFKAYDSAILTLRNLIATYPRAAVVADALARLVGAYRALKYEEDLRQTCQYIRQFYPQVVPDLAEQCPAAADTS